MDFEEDIDIDSAAQSVTSSVVEENISEIVIQSEIQAETPKVAPNPAPAATKQTSTLVWNISNMPAGGPTIATNTLFNTNFYPEYATKTYIDRWQQNFEYILGPAIQRLLMQH